MCKCVQKNCCKIFLLACNETISEQFFQSFVFIVTLLHSIFLNLYLKAFISFTHIVLRTTLLDGCYKLLNRQKGNRTCNINRGNLLQCSAFSLYINQPSRLYTLYVCCMFIISFTSIIIICWSYILYTFLHFLRFFLFYFSNKKVLFFLLTLHIFFPFYICTKNCSS